jgi:hypothetical protein
MTFWNQRAEQIRQERDEWRECARVLAEAVSHPWWGARRDHAAQLTDLLAKQRKARELFRKLEGRYER